MKQILIAFFALMPLVSIAQDFPKESDETKMIFVETVDAPGKTKTELYSALKLAVANVYNSSTNVTKVDDAENGVILIKALYTDGVPYDGLINYTLRIDTKDGKYRMVMYDFSHKRTVRSATVGTYNADGGALTNEIPACGRFNMMGMGKWVKCKETARPYASNTFRVIKNYAETPVKSDW